MKKIIYSIIAAITILISTSQVSNASSSKGTEFWIGFMENLSLSFNGPPKFSFQITSDVATSGNLTFPYTGFSMPFTVTPNQVTQIFLPQGIFYPQGDEAIINNGIKITSNDPIEVYAFHFRAYFTESTLVLPIAEIGTDYLVIAQKDTLSVSPSEFIIVATQDSTTVEIIPSALTLGFRPIGVPFTVTLQEGQVYQLQSYDDLTGTSITSLNPQKKIAVFGGSRQATVGCTNLADDHIYDEIYPLSSWGTSYSLIPFTIHSGDVFKIVASTNSTVVTLASGANYNLNRGQFINLLLYTTEIVTANHPIAIAQVSTSQDCNASLQAKGDASMICLTPDNLFKKKATFYTPSYLTLSTLAVVFPQHYLNILVPNNAVNVITLDNNSIASFFNPLPNSANYSYAHITLDTLSSLVHTLQCDSGFNATVYAFADYNAYSHHLGFDEDELTGLNEIQGENNIVIFPNPANNFIEMKFPDEINTIEIINSLGQIIYSKTTADENSLKVSVNEFPTGIYFVKFISRNDNFSSKFSVIK